MYEILIIIYLVVALALVGFILIQQGKGAGMGASFGAGASGTVFGAGGSGNFLTKTTTILAIIFFGVALALGNLTSDKTASVNENSLFPGEATEQQVPATDIPEANLVEQTAGDLPVESQTDIPETVVVPATDETIKEDNKEDDTKDGDTSH